MKTHDLLYKFPSAVIFLMRIFGPTLLPARRFPASRARKTVCVPILILLLFSAHQAGAATFTVTTATDNTFGSLRQAIQNANNTPGLDTIAFNIGGGGLQTITPSSDFPQITESVTIDGTTQPGYAGAPLIEINATNTSKAFWFNISSQTQGIFIVKGLIINRAAQAGIYVTTGANNNSSTIVRGCYIGTNSAGTTDLGNGFVGIDVSNGALFVGGANANDRNVISGNGSAGIAYGSTFGSDGSTDPIEIMNNYIGTNAAGNADLGNDNAGIHIVGGGSITIGGETSNLRNLISGNNAKGIYVRTFDAVTQIQNNYIGTNAAGTAAIGNGGDGIEVIDSSAVTVGGIGQSQRNIISGNGGNGISLNHLSSVKIYNNYIGTNAAGSADLGNALDGINVRGAAIIGGTSAGLPLNLGNVISGNNANGIHLDTGDAVTVQRNLIGTNLTGTADLGNSNNGIYIERNSTENEPLIGSSTNALNGNVISGNNGDGIRLGAFSGGVNIYGNKIGANAAADAIVPNLGDGIEIVSSANQIGLSGSAAARNIIVGNGQDGINLTGAASTGNFIRNNFIGTNAAGADLGNVANGITVSASQNTIGGEGTESGNTIAFNAHGVYIVSSSNNNVQGNTIHSNSGNGVSVTFNAQTGNSIRRNSIYSNQELGINLGPNGVTPNDVNDADTGPNNLQNFPVLQRVTQSRISGSLNSLANQLFTIDFYRVDSCDASGHGEGRYHVVSFTVVTNGNNAALDIPFAGFTNGQIVTATATDTAGNTSEFSPCATVAPETVNVQFSAAAYTVGENGGSATVTVTRTGDTSGAVSVNYATSNGTATAGQDYTAASGTLSFAAGDTSKTFTVPVFDDQLPEDAETVNLALSNPTGGAVIGTPGTAVLTINDNEACAFSINPTSVITSAAGGNGLVAVTTQSGCAWTAVSNDGWISVTGGANGSGNGTVNYSISSNPDAARSGTITIAGQTFTVNQAAASLTRKPADFDGDGKTDVSIYRPSNGQWWYNRSSDNLTFAFQFGVSTDRITPGDFDGDGKTDAAFWRPSTGEWFVLRSSNSTFYSVPFGASGDIPAPGDYDADGKTDVAVFRPSEATWYISLTSGGTVITQWGAGGDVPVAADYDGDGHTDIAIFRPSDGSWWINKSSGGNIVVVFGSSADKPVHGDYTGDGKTDIAVFRPATGEWFVLRSEDFSYYSVPFGSVGDVPAPGDFDGDGKWDLAVFRPSDTNWYVQKSSGGFLIQQFGAGGDRPVPGGYLPQ